MGLYTITDTVFVSRFVNTDALSAVNIVCPVINLIVGLGTMAASGGSAVIARKMGEGKGTQARQNFTLLILTGGCLGILITISGVLFLDDVIWGLGASKLLYSYCRDYLLILLIFTPASILQILFQSLLVTAGRPGIGMMVSVGAGAANILLDYIFMVPFHMGIAGSALGTGISYLIPTITGILFFAKTKEELRFEIPLMDAEMLTESCLNGSSELVSQASFAVTTFLFNAVMMKLLGEDGIAAITIIIYTQFMLTTLFIGFSMGTAPIFSYHYGSHNHSCLRRIFKFCLFFIITSSILIFIGTTAFASWLIAVFSLEGSAVYRIAHNGLLIFSFSYLFCGINIFSSSFFTALSNGKVSAAISLFPNLRYDHNRTFNPAQNLGCKWDMDGRTFSGSSDCGNVRILYI